MCILFPKLFWLTVRKNCSSDWEKLLRSLDQSIRTVKGQYNFGNRMQFYLASGGFSELIQLDFKLEKIIGI